MKSFREPSFQDRIGAAAKAKQRALEALKSKAPMDPKVAAERAEAHAKREAARAEQSAAMQSARDSAKTAKADEAASQEVAPVAATEEELKAARDARYAARKSRK